MHSQILIFNDVMCGTIMVVPKHYLKKCQTSLSAEKPRLINFYLRNQNILEITVGENSTHFMDDPIGVP